MSSEFDKQVGGDHYKNLRIQPIQLAEKYDGDWVVLTVHKYLVRNKENNYQDLCKARDVLEKVVSLRGFMSLKTQEFIEMGQSDHHDIEEIYLDLVDSELLYPNARYMVISLVCRGFYEDALDTLNYLVINKYEEGIKND